MLELFPNMQKNIINGYASSSSKKKGKGTVDSLFDLLKLS